MLVYVVIVLIAIWILLVAWVKYRRWRLKHEGADAPPSESAMPGASVDDIDFEAITLTIKGSIRDAFFEPPDAEEALPLLLCFHGGLGNAQHFAESSGLAVRARAWGYLAVFPDAEEGWVDGRPERGSGTEDIEFVVALVKELAGRHLIDPARVFAVGLSNGGMFVQHLATNRPGLLAGAASVLASVPIAVAEATSKGPPMPFVLACDRGDAVMPFDGGEILSTPGLGVGGQVVPVEEARSIWVARNGAGAARAPRRVTAAGGYSATIFDHPAGAAGAPMRFVEIYGMGHRWPRWPGAAGAPEVNAADFALEFFASRAVQDFAARSFKENQWMAQTGSETS
jgi:polyhydroxybutyrate depolymerase